MMREAVSVTLATMTWAGLDGQENSVRLESSAKRDRFGLRLGRGVDPRFDLANLLQDLTAKEHTGMKTIGTAQT